METFYQWVSGVVTSTGLAGCIAFMLDYQRRSRGSWYESGEGRYFMATSSILGSLFLLVLSVQVFGDWPGRRLVGVILYTLYAVFPWWLWVLLRRATRDRIGD